MIVLSIFLYYDIVIKLDLELNSSQLNLLLKRL